MPDIIRKKQLEYTLGLLILLIIIALVLLGITAYGLFTDRPTIDKPAPSDPLTKADLEAQIEFLEEQLEIANATTKNEIRSEFFFYLVVFTIIGAGVGIIGGEEFLKQRTKEYMESLREGIDPFNIPINIPAEGFFREKDLLRRIGFKNLLPYNADSDHLDDSLLRGIFVYQIQKNSKEETEAELNKITTFLKKSRMRFNDRSLGCVVYITNNMRPDLEHQIEILPLTVTANMPSTIATQIFALARAIKLDQ